MNRKMRKREHFKYKPKKVKGLKSRSKRDRWQEGDDGWKGHWKARDLRILRKLVIRDEQDLDGNYEVRYTVKFPEYITTVGEAKDYLGAVFYKSCNHTHDCCGCFFSSVWTHTFRHTKGKEYVIRVDYRRNV